MNSAPQSQTQSQTQATDAPARKPDPLAEFQAVVGTIRDSSHRYLAAAGDTMRARLRQALVRALVVLVAGLVLFVVVVVAAILVLVGAAQGLAAGLKLPVWAGLLIVGGGIVLLAVIGARAGIAFVEKRTVEQARERIAQRAAARRSA